jgi:methionyl-tRNA synthetase
VTALVYPVIPQSAAKIWAQLGMSEPIESVRLADLKWGQLPVGQKIGEVSGIFPRLDLKTTVDKLWEAEAAEKDRQAALLGKARVPIQPIAETISIDDFGKVDLRVGVVKSAEAVKNADKLLHLKIDIGEAQPRTIVAGIAKAYKPEDLVGRKVVIVANLAPRKLKGIESQGMIVAASLEGGSPVLAGFLENIDIGARLK